MSFERSPADEDAELAVAVEAMPAIAELQRDAEATIVPAAECESSHAADAATISGGSIVRGSLWTIGGYAAGQVLRLTGNIVVSRLVLPEAFGIMAIVNVLIQGLTMFSDVGIEPVLVQNRRGDEPRFYDTAWTVQVVRGFVLFLFALLLAWPISVWYREPRLAYLLPAAAAATIVAGFNSTALYAVRRHMLVGRLTAIELLAQITGVVVMCGTALVEPSAWAMVAGVLASAAVTLGVSHRLIPGYRNRFAWDPTAFAELVHFGKWILVSTIISFCAMQIDRLMLGRLIAIDRLGVYSVALAIAMLPNMLLQSLTGAILYPLLARTVRQSTDGLATSLSAARGVLMSLGTLCVVGVVLEAPTFFFLVYDERYAAAGVIAQLLALQVWVSLLGITLERALQALGDSRSLAAANFAKVTASALGALVGFYYAELPGFILGYAVGAICGQFVLQRRLQEHGVSAWRDDLRASCLTAIAVCFGLSLAHCGERWGGLLGRELATWPFLAALAVRPLVGVRRLRLLRQA